jgi:hypothetical protein
LLLQATKNTIYQKYIGMIRRKLDELIDKEMLGGPYWGIL